MAPGLAVAHRSAEHLQTSVLCASQEDRHSRGSRCPIIWFRCLGPGGKTQVVSAEVLGGVSVSWGFEAKYHELV